MKTRCMGITRKIDFVGRLVIPKEIRKQHNLNKGDEVSIINKPNHIIIKKYQKSCIFCGSTEDVIEYNDICVCKKCRDYLNR